MKISSNLCPYGSPTVLFLLQILMPFVEWLIVNNDDAALSSWLKSIHLWIVVNLNGSATFVVRLMVLSFFIYIYNLFYAFIFSGYLDTKINCRLKLYVHIQINFITSKSYRTNRNYTVINMKRKFVMYEIFEIYENLFRENLILQKCNHYYYYLIII